MSLKRFAFATALVTFVLVWIGGLVTSHEAGMSVPDWPTSYGYNMFFFPVSKWMGGILYEHSHRLVASLVGLLTSILALWLFGRNSRPLIRWIGIIFIVAGIALTFVFPKHAAENLMTSGMGLIGLIASFYWPACEPSAKWLRTLGVIAFVAVVIQGMLGGFRVTQKMAELGIFHGALAQMFFALICAIALFHSDFWRSLPMHAERDQRHFRMLFTVTTALVLCQLVLGATMRHQHAGLAIPDFPAAYGKLWPDTDPAAIARYNQQRNTISEDALITAAQVELQMAHRILALVVFSLVGLCAWRAWRGLGSKHVLTRFSFIWFALVSLQLVLGAATILTAKAADIATAHVACGALCLVTGTLASIVSFRLLTVPAAQLAGAEKNEVTSLLASSSIVAK